jgi:hypothetical protein
LKLAKSEAQEKIDALVERRAKKAHTFLYTPSKSRVNKIVIKVIEEKLRAGPVTPCAHEAL